MAVVIAPAQQKCADREALGERGSDEYRRGAAAA